MTSKRKRLAPLRDLELSLRERTDRFIRDEVEGAGYICTRTMTSRCPRVDGVLAEAERRQRS